MNNERNYALGFSSGLTFARSRLEKIVADIDNMSRTELKETLGKLLTAITEQEKWYVAETLRPQQQVSSDKDRT